MGADCKPALARRSMARTADGRVTHRPGRADKAWRQSPVKNYSMRRGLTLSLWIFSLILAACGASPTRPLKPVAPTPTEGALVIKPEARPVSFEELATNPRLFLNNRLQVTGSLARLSLPDCTPYKGPPIRWALVAQNLQMNAFGYDAILQLAAEGDILTVEGVWQFYNGPLGCGKEPSRVGLWYLAVTRIVQPNPLARGGGGVTPVSAEPTAIDVAGATTVLEATPTPAGDDAGLLPPTLPPSLTPTPINVAPPTGAPTTGPSATPTAPPRATQATSQPTPTADVTPTPTPGPSGTPPPTAFPTLPSGPGTPGGCGYPPGDDCKTSTPYP